MSQFSFVWTLMLFLLRWKSQCSDRPWPLHKILGFFFYFYSLISKLKFRFADFPISMEVLSIIQKISFENEIMFCRVIDILYFTSIWSCSKRNLNGKLSVFYYVTKIKYSFWNKKSSLWQVFFLALISLQMKQVFFCWAVYSTGSSWRFTLFVTALKINKTNSLLFYF